MIPELTAPEPTDSGTVVMPEVAIPAWSWAVAVVAAIAIYMVTLENGALLGSMASGVHEFFHDGRHLFAVPCH